MKLYEIREKLQEIDAETLKKHAYPYVAIVTAEEFYGNMNLFDMGIDMDLDLSGEMLTGCEVNYDALIGTFNVPDRKDITGESRHFAFALDEKGVAFINDDGMAQSLIDGIMRQKKWKFPCLERFLFDFMEQITDKDLAILEKYEVELDQMEESIQKQEEEDFLGRLADIRSEIRELRLNYEQLLDLAQEFEENENEFFKEDNLRFFSLYARRVQGLLEIVSTIREHTIHVRELYHTELEAKQNRLMTILTVVATIFVPLTLITGWYGMNFVHMPELQFVFSYPIVFGVSVAIVIGCIIYFKKHKWL